MISQKIKNKTVVDKIGITPVVVLPLEDYESMREEIEILSSKKLANEITKARREIKKGEVYSTEEIKRKLLLNK
jgi:PHD/YefM family antitoxin component YafN of YafNO toxin-antitoxin module